MSADFPLCFSCRVPMDPVTGKRLEGGAPLDGRAGEKLCAECIKRVEDEQLEEEERKLWPPR